LIYNDWSLFRILQNNEKRHIIIVKKRQNVAGGKFTQKKNCHSGSTTLGLPK